MLPLLGTSSFGLRTLQAQLWVPGKGVWYEPTSTDKASIPLLQHSLPGLSSSSDHFCQRKGRLGLLENCKSSHVVDCTAVDSCCGIITADLPL